MSDTSETSLPAAFLIELTPVRRAAIAFACVCAFVASVNAFFSSLSAKAPFLLMPIGCAAAAIICAQLRPFGIQILARAFQWSNLVLACVIAFAGTHREHLDAVFLAAACAGALLLMGEQGLVEHHRDARFLPASFRSSLLLLTVIAVADAQFFGLVGAASRLERESAIFKFALLGSAASLCVGCVLLMRLSLVGLYMNVAASLAVVFVALNERGHALAVPLLAIACMHLAVAVPTLIAVLRGKTLLPPMRARTRALVTKGVLCGIPTLVGAFWIYKRLALRF
jgi:hypothetical protein